MQTRPQGVLQKIIWCACWTSKFWLSLSLFSSPFTTGQYTKFVKQKHPILAKLGAFYNNLLKIHPIYVIWASSSVMRTHWSIYQNSWKKAPQKAGTCIPCQCESPPPGQDLIRAIESMSSLHYAYSLGFTHLIVSFWHFKHTVSSKMTPNVFSFFFLPPHSALYHKLCLDASEW